MTGGLREGDFGIVATVVTVETASTLAFDFEPDALDILVDSFAFFIGGPLLLAISSNSEAAFEADLDASMPSPTVTVTVSLLLTPSEVSKSSSSPTFSANHPLLMPSHRAKI